MLRNVMWPFSDVAPCPLGPGMISPSEFHTMLVPKVSLDIISKCCLIRLDLKYCLGSQIALVLQEVGAK